MSIIEGPIVIYTVINKVEEGVLVKLGTVIGDINLSIESMKGDSIHK